MDGLYIRGCWVGGSASNIISVAEDWVEIFFSAQEALYWYLIFTIYT